MATSGRPTGTPWGNPTHRRPILGQTLQAACRVVLPRAASCRVFAMMGGGIGRARSQPHGNPRKRNGLRMTPSRANAVRSSRESGTCHRRRGLGFQLAIPNTEAARGACPARLDIDASPCRPPRLYQEDVADSGSEPRPSFPDGPTAGASPSDDRAPHQRRVEETHRVGPGCESGQWRLGTTRPQCRTEAVPSSDDPGPMDRRGRSEGPLTRGAGQ